MASRRPRTTQERRADQQLVRAKRNRKNLVNSYDDIRVDRQRSWKKHRKTKHKSGGE